jgi:hypothetical protein
MHKKPLAFTVLFSKTFRILKCKSDFILNQKPDPAAAFLSLATKVEFSGMLVSINSKAKNIRRFLQNKIFSRKFLLTKMIVVDYICHQYQIKFYKDVNTARIEIAAPYLL